MAKKQRVPPSRLRYEAQNPSLTVRLTRPIRDVLCKIAKEEDLSYSDILKDAFEKAAKSYEYGYAAGYYDADNDFRITFPCSVCYKDITMFPDSGPHEDIAEYLLNKGWSHGDCHN